MHHNELHSKHQGKRVSKRLPVASEWVARSRSQAVSFLTSLFSAIWSDGLLGRGGPPALYPLSIQPRIQACPWWVWITQCSVAVDTHPCHFMWSERENMPLYQNFCDGHGQVHSVPKVSGGTLRGVGVKIF